MTSVSDWQEDSTIEIILEKKDSSEGKSKEGDEDDRTRSQASDE